MTTPNLAIWNAFQTDWERSHFGQIPMKQAFRVNQQLPWVRFHSLPGSERYPATVREENIIVERAIVLGDAMLGRGCECWQVECRADAELEQCKHAASSASAAQTIVYDEVEWTLYVASEIWEPSERLAAQLLAIANEESWPKFWMSKENGQIFAPYDGGFDLFPISNDEVQRLRIAHRDWLSPLPSGL
ncbi:hypothetical protein QO002_001155 [Pararhizobium capsulatum DSM 1112]|uniref:DUF3885 domain-containing protein n=1 Tax=Pararhizobium capsulatum DSM 1112 TaxID=1121113 RepID=A0ABU0BLA1_9HYPH|nr:hypothetical protein [Pararhizobium capsulatum]MDQ0319017.1 hypothetical protein [Pararhizobium capsulatum DSM 1112]